MLHYVKTAVNRLDLSKLKAFSLDETKSRKGHRYVTVFIDLDRADKPVVFAVAGKGKQTFLLRQAHISVKMQSVASAQYCYGPWLGSPWFVRSFSQNHYTPKELSEPPIIDHL